MLSDMVAYGLVWACLLIFFPPHLHVISPLRSQRAVYSRTASRVCRRGTWLNQEKEPSKDLSHSCITHQQDLVVMYMLRRCPLSLMCSCLWQLTLQMPPSSFLLGSSGDLKWSMWRRGLLERSLNAGLTNHGRWTAFKPSNAPGWSTVYMYCETVWPWRPQLPTMPLM